MAAKKKEDVDPADSDEDIYTEQGMEELEESDAISPLEEGFMEGEMSEGEQTVCGNCNKVLGEDSNVVEREIKGTIHRFCTLTCAEHYMAEGPAEKPSKPLRIGEKKE
jgi:hypothetical protein